MGAFLLKVQPGPVRHIKKFNPDLLIVRLDENVNSDSVQQHLGKLMAALKGPRTKVVLVSSFWGGNQSLAAMQAYNEVTEAAYGPLLQLGSDPTYKAIGQFANEGVASHHSDKGMQAIADAI